MVVAVSFRKASDPSYSSIVGAAETSHVFTDPFPRPSTFSTHLKCEERKERPRSPEMFVVTLSVVAGPNPLEVDARMESW